MADQSSVEDRLRALMDKVAKVKDGRAGRDGDGDGILNEKDIMRQPGAHVVDRHGKFKLVTHRGGASLSTPEDSRWALMHGDKVVAEGIREGGGKYVGAVKGTGELWAAYTPSETIDLYGRRYADKLVTEAQDSGRDIVATFRAAQSALKRSKSQKNHAAFMQASEAMDKMIKASHAQQNIGHQMIYDLSQPRKKTDQMDLFAKRNRILNDRLKG
jgi:hypothetical protein